MKKVEENYFKLIELGATPQEARSILPNSLKTEIYVTMNIREWRHYLRLRCGTGAHPQIREVSYMIYDIFMEKLPALFEDLELPER